jgi:hypothetical protein
MTEPEDPKSNPPDSEPNTDETDAPDPAKELKAAFGHLKSAAGLFLGRLQNDEHLKKAMADAESAAERAASGIERAAGTAAVEAEKAVRSLGEKAQPLAKDLGSEIERLAKSMRSVLEPEPIPRESTPDDPEDLAAGGPPADHDREKNEAKDQEANESKARKDEAKDGDD